MPDKYVLIGAPHTSNWDFPIALLLLRLMGIEGHWIAKHTVFRWPVGRLMRWLGGLPVDRTASHNFVDQIVQLFEERERLVITIAPEGTRKKNGPLENRVLLYRARRWRPDRSRIPRLSQQARWTGADHSAQRRPRGRPGPHEGVLRGQDGTAPRQDGGDSDRQLAKKRPHVRSTCGRWGYSA